MSFKGRCSIVGVFVNIGYAAESSIGMFIAMGINTLPSLTFNNAGLLTTCTFLLVMIMNRM